MDDDIVKNKVKEEIRFLLYNKRNIIIKINNIKILIILFNKRIIKVFYWNINFIMIH